MTRAFSVLVCIGLAGACAVALASPTAAYAQGDKGKRALEVGYEADRLFASGKWAEAYDKFKEADGLAHSPVFVLYMARSRRNDGKLTAAMEIYAQVAAEKLAPKAPPPFVTAVSDATSELEELRARIPAARVELKHRPPGDVEVTIDGNPARLSVKVLLDPGTHVVVAKNVWRSGAMPPREVTKSVDLAAGAGEVVVELEFDGPAVTPAGLRVEPKRGSIIPGALLLAFGGAGLAVGAITGGLATKQAGDIKENCNVTHCLKSDADAIDQANLLANVATGTLIAGGVLATVGLVLVIVRPGSGSPAVAIGPGFVSLRTAF